MVIAESYYAALKAADLVKVEWTAGPGADVSEQQLQDHALALVRKDEGGVRLDIPDDDTTPAFSAAGATTIEQIYTTATALHFPLEPVNALAFEKDGVFEIHTGNQWQSLIMPTIAKALGRPESEHRAAHLSARRRLRAAAERGLYHSGRAGREGAGTAGEDDADTRG